MLGGIAGSHVGGGSGQVVGAIAGAVLGGIIGQRRRAGRQRSAPGVEITVLLDSGKYIAIVQEADEPFRAGDRVRVLSGPRRRPASRINARAHGRDRSARAALDAHGSRTSLAARR